MPDTIRISGGCARPWRSGFARAVVAAIGTLLGTFLPAPSFAEEQPALALHELVLTAQDSIDRHEIAVLVLVLGLIFFTSSLRSCCCGHMRAHRGSNPAPATRSPRCAVNSTRQRAVVFGAAGADRLAGGVGPAEHRRRSVDRRRVRGAPRARLRNWLEAGKAAAMEQAVEALRSRGEGFSLTLTTLSGHPIEAQGRAVGAGRCCG